MFVLVLWARVCHICSRMHIHTRAYVTKKKPHVHACRHMCHSSCPTAPIDIRPRPPISPEAPQLNPEPHAWPATAGTCSPEQGSAEGLDLPRGQLHQPAAGQRSRPGPNSDLPRAGAGIASRPGAIQLCSSQAVAGPGLYQRRPRPNTGPTGKGTGTTSTNTGQGQQGGSQGNKAASTIARAHTAVEEEQQGSRGQGACTAAGQGKKRHSQGGKERYWVVSSRFRVSRHGEC